MICNLQYLQASLQLKGYTRLYLRLFLLSSGLVMLEAQLWAVMHDCTADSDIVPISVAPLSMFPICLVAGDQPSFMRSWQHLPMP